MRTQSIALVASSVLVVVINLIGCSSPPNDGASGFAPGGASGTAGGAAPIAGASGAAQAGAGGSAAQALPSLRPEGASARPVPIAAPPAGTNRAPARAEGSSGPGLLLGVAALCLVAGVLLAVVVMRLLGR